MAARDGLILKFSTDLLPAQKSIQDFAVNAVSMLSSVARQASTSATALNAYGKGKGRWPGSWVRGPAA